MVIREGGDYQAMLAADGAPPETPAAAAPAPRKEWLSAHPYLAATIGVGGLILLGTIVVLQRTDVDPANSSGAWGGAGGVFAGTVRRITSSGPDPADVVRMQSQGNYAVVPIYTPPSESTTTADGITELLAQIVQNTPVSVAFETSADAPDSFSYIPQGLISAEPHRKALSADQQSLFDYGNMLGTYLKGYEDMHYGSAQILKDQVEDRTNPDKIRAVKILAADMQQFGYDLRALANVPSIAAGIHAAYADAYIAAGKNLAAVPDAASDDAFVDAITAYNASVERLTTQFLLLVALFGTHDVAFAAQDAGTVFMFNPNLSLSQ